MTTFYIMIAAFIAGGMNALAGGGTFVLFPTLTGVAGLSDKVANIASTLGLWPASAATVVTARRDLAHIPRKLLWTMALISLVGGASGAWTLLNTSERTFTYLIPWLLAFATLVFAFAKPIARWAGRHQGERHTGWTVAVLSLQIVIAFYGGYFGAGIGVLMLAGLSFLGLEDLHQCNALKVLLATVINATATVVFLSATIPWAYVLPMIAASITGGVLGMKLARRLPADKLRGVILLVGITLTLAYFWKVYGAK
jgi:uncharacterized membrane protein YfcA